MAGPLSEWGAIRVERQEPGSLQEQNLQLPR